MVIGQYKSKLTEKDRISVPKKIRQEFGESMVIARWYESCLVLVSKESWESLLERLTGGSRIVTSAVRDLDRFIYASAFEINLDSQGRFVLPENLISYAGIKDEVVFVGLGDRVEIWNLQTWNLLEETVQEKAQKAVENIAGKEK